MTDPQHITDSTTEHMPDEACALMTSAMKAGDENAWRQFHEQHYTWLIASATSRLSPSGDASEIVQLIYLRAVRHIKTFRQTTQLRNWLLCLMRCVIIDHSRQVKRRSVLTEKFQLWQETRRSSSAPDDLTSPQLTDALAALPQGDATLIARKYIEGWSTKELARDAKLSPKAVESKLARLRKQLRNQFTTH